MKSFKLKTPCCNKDIFYEDILNVCEWHIKGTTFEIRKGILEWSYYKCKFCGEACFIGYNENAIINGIFGAAPVPDLIPVSEILWKPQIITNGETTKIIFDKSQFTIPYKRTLTEI